MSEIYARIYKIVCGIPKGRVLTYGLISHMIGGRMSAQGVGWALKALGNAKPAQKADKTARIKAASGGKPKNRSKQNLNLETVPWHRVVNASGGTSTQKLPDVPPGLQQKLLEAEGIVFDNEGKMDLHKYLWTEGLVEENDT